MNRRDPRIRQTLDRISSGLESASISVQASLFAFSESYVKPCLGSTSSCLESSCYPCWGARRDRARARQRHLSRGTRPELNFDFYNAAWDDDEYENEGGDAERAGLLGGWGADELDRLLAGSGGGSNGAEQPRRGGAHMNYGSHGGTTVGAVAGRRTKNGGVSGAKGGEVDPTVLPGSSMFGFLERLPWKIGGRGLRYKPSAADLQENPGRAKGHREAADSLAISDSLGGEGQYNHGENEGLLADNDNAGPHGDEYFDGGINGTRSARDDPLSRSMQHRRQRSNTGASRSTANSLSSRGDLLPSSDEDDAVPLDDEFHVALGRRDTGQDSLGGASGGGRSGDSSGKGSGSGGKKSKRSSRRGRRRRSGGTGTSKDSEGQEEEQMEVESPLPLQRHDSVAKLLGEDVDDDADDGLPSLEALQREEERVRAEEEEEVRRKRVEARAVAIERGLLDARETEAELQPEPQAQSQAGSTGESRERNPSGAEAKQEDGDRSAHI